MKTQYRILSLVLVVMLSSVNVYSEQDIAENRTQGPKLNELQTSTPAEWAGGLIGLGVGYGMIYFFAKDRKNIGESIVTNKGYYLMPFSVSAGVSIAGAIDNREGSYAYSGLTGCGGAIAGEVLVFATILAFSFKDFDKVADDDYEEPKYQEVILASLFFGVTPLLELVGAVMGYNYGKSKIRTDALLNIDDSNIEFGIPAVSLESGYNYNNEMIYTARLVKFRF